MTAQNNTPKKFDLSAIFKRAWVLVKTASQTLSSALKQAWAETKQATKEIAIVPGAMAVVAPAFEPTHKFLVGGAYGEYKFCTIDTTIIKYRDAVIAGKMEDGTQLEVKKTGGVISRKNPNPRTFIEVYYNGQWIQAREISPSSEEVTLISSTRVWNESEGCYGDLLEYSNGKKKLVLDY